VVLVRDVLGVGSDFGSLGFVSTRRFGAEFLLFRGRRDSRNARYDDDPCEW
jgi:hypothetical protein